MTTRYPVIFTSSPVDSSSCRAAAQRHKDLSQSDFKISRWVEASHQLQINFRKQLTLQLWTHSDLLTFSRNRVNLFQDLDLTVNADFKLWTLINKQTQTCGRFCSMQTRHRRWIVCMTAGPVVGSNPAAPPVHLIVQQSWTANSNKAESHGIRFIKPDTRLIQVQMSQRQLSPRSRFTEQGQV